MRIAQVSPLYERVPPKMYGGTERVVSYLTEELVKRGHSVTLFASGDSLTKATLRAPCRRALRLDEKCQDRLAPHLRMLGWVYQQAASFDLIHCHTEYLGLALARSCPIPTVVTLHGRLDIPEANVMYYEYPEANLVSISDHQRLPMPFVNWADTVYHGLPAELYGYRAQAGSYLLFLGRISPEKRPDTAIRIALQTGIPLRIAAKVDNADREYFNEVIKPLLNNPLIDFIGEVDEPRKRELIANALALLFPIDWPEPFGLVMIEALACGTPVIARSRGSVPEVLQHGVTGLVCETEEEMVAAVAKVGRLSRKQCRAEFERRFTAGVMAANYERLYERLVQRARSKDALTTTETDRSVVPLYVRSTKDLRPVD